MAPFEIQQLDDHTLRITGELDMHTSPRLDDAICQMLGATEDLVLDLSGVPFMDSSGIHVLLDGVWAMGEHRRLVIRRPSAFVARVLEVSGLAPPPPNFALAIEWADDPVPQRGGPGAMYRLAALVNASLDAARRSRRLTRESLVLVEHARAARADATAFRAARQPGPVAA